LTEAYDSEQEQLDTEITELQTAIDSYNTDSVRVDKFIELAKRHTEFNELSASVLNEFIEKIIVHEAVKINGKREQQIDIYLNYIGKFELPESEMPEEEPQKTIGSRGRKLRRDMTEEELTRVRELDRIGYAKKAYAKQAAARKAADEAQRVAILQGTSYEAPTNESGVEKIAS
jgi:hypothetical protein